MSVTPCELTFSFLYSICRLHLAFPSKLCYFCVICVGSFNIHFLVLWSCRWLKCSLRDCGLMVVSYGSSHLLKVLEQGVRAGLPVLVEVRTTLPPESCSTASPWQLLSLHTTSDESSRWHWCSAADLACILTARQYSWVSPHVHHANPGTSLHSYLASFNPALSLALKYSKGGKDFVNSMRPV